MGKIVIENYTRNYYGADTNDNTVQVLYFEYKTYMNQVFKIKNNDKTSQICLKLVFTIKILQ